LQAALREAEEETALPAAQVQPLGFLDGYLTVTGYFVVPVVARLHGPLQLTPHAGEVDEIFNVPLAFFLDAANRETHSREWQGLTRHYYVYPYQQRYVWGATAGMLKNLADRFGADHG
jgi:8-oxo-dGTP pyrophosphatase MutT (NUDIX family)